MVQSRRLARLLCTLGGVIGAFALLAPVAGATTPAPGYGEFAGCPDNAEISTCIRTELTGGHFQMGNKDVPITQKMVLSGGVHNDGTGFQGSLSAAKQKVPGGVVGITGLTWLAELLGIEALTLYAVTELAGTPDVISEPAVLPIKVHLVNPVLGNNCRVGSNSEPITLHLTIGTTSPPAPNKPITGKAPEVTFDESLAIFHANNGEFVDNSFSAPGANGCVLTLFGFIPISLNGLVNTASGLPAAAGTNETRQNFNLSLAASELVYP